MNTYNNDKNNFEIQATIVRSGPTSEELRCIEMEYICEMMRIGIVGISYNELFFPRLIHT